MKRFLKLTDLFTITCKKCNSNNIDLIPSSCDECGDIISAICNSCGSKYDYHDFKMIEEKK